MRILIVDDITENRYMLESLLKGFGYEVVTARNGVEALKRLECDGVEMIISDIMMPKMDGFELCKRCKEDERLRKLPFIFYTATYTAKKDMEFGLSLGASRYIIKPKEPGAFMEDIREVLAEAERIEVPEVSEKSMEELEKLEEMHSEVLSRKLEKKVADLEEERVALRESEMKYRRLIEGLKADYFFYSHDTKGIFTYLSPSIKSVLGYSQDEFFTHYTEYLTGNPVNKKAEYHSELSMKGEEQPPYEIEVYHKDGGKRWLEVKETPLIDKREKVVSVEGIAHDITERKEAEERIRREVILNKNLLQISEATLHTTSIDRLMRDVVKSTLDSMCSDVILSYLWDEETGCFRPAESAGLPVALKAFFKTEIIPEDTTFVKEAFVKGNVGIHYIDSEEFCKELEESGLFKWLEDISVIATLPLKGRSRDLGLMVCICRSIDKVALDDCISEKETVFLKAITNQLSTALEEALQYKSSLNMAMELSRKVETIETMNEIGKSILSEHESKLILETTIRMISHLVACDWVRVITVDLEKEELNFMVGFAEDDVARNTIVKFEDTCLVDVVLTHRPQYIPEIGDLSEKLLIERQLFDNGFRSILRVPIVIKGKIFGVLGIISRRPSAFTREDHNVLEKLVSHIGVALENAKLVTNLEELFLGTVRTLSSAIDAKSAWTKGHSDRVTEYALKIATELGWNREELKVLELLGLLHDIGKLGTYEVILDKPGKLTDEELNIIRQHPVKGAEILSHIKQLKDIIPALLHHHEFYDGTGYPDGLKGEDIPLMARILAVADTADAMGADRPYRKGMPMEKIIEELKRCSGTQFDPEVVEAFLKVF